MYYYLFKKLYNIFFVKEEKEDNHRPMESCRPIRRMAITRKPKYILELDSDSDSSDIDLKKTANTDLESYLGMTGLWYGSASASTWILRQDLHKGTARASHGGERRTSPVV